MELQTVSHVSKTYGISARMLRYYEQNGLVKSLRKEGYSYRVYDSENIKRLQQIVILRKLQISVKQICVIINNPKATAVIDIFKENISELEKEISALSTIKSILENFVSAIEKITAIHLSLDLLNEDSVQRLAKSLSLVQKNVKENRTMEELNRAAENLDKLKDKFVRVVKLPPMTVAHLVSHDANDSIGNTRNMMEKFIKDVNLLTKKPDFRYFGYGSGHSEYHFMVTIPEDLEISAPLTKTIYPGGLFAAYTETPGEDDWKPVEEWAEDSENYEWEARGPRIEEHFNPYNIYGLKQTDSEYVDKLFPIREIEKITEKQKEKLNTAEKCFSQSKPTEIDLTTMVKHGKLDLSYENGLMVLTVEVDVNGMATPRQFKLPLKIELRAKTNDMNIRIRYGSGILVFNWEHIRTTLLMSDITDGSYSFHKKRGEIPVDEFVDIEWIFGRDVMAVKVNGEIRHIGNDYGYIKSFRENPEFSLSSPITLTGAFGSTITVEKLRITEI